MANKWRTQAERDAFFLSKKVDKAVRDHRMIEDGDRILVGVSGGKDSMSLLRLLGYGLQQSQAKYSLVAAHVRGDARGADVSVPDSFVQWLEGEGAPFVIRDIRLPENEPLPMDCERCSRNRRRTLFEIAGEHGCNKVALGHNLEDLAHTALINLFLHGRLETMSPARDYFGGTFRLIRPLAYIRENDLVRFARVCEFPVVETDCSMAPVSRRRAASEMMKRLSSEFRNANVNIVKAACRDSAGFEGLE